MFQSLIKPLPTSSGESWKRAANECCSFYHLVPFAHLPWLLFPDIRGELTRSFYMGMGWLINLVIAKLVIAHKFGIKL